MSGRTKSLPGRGIALMVIPPNFPGSIEGLLTLLFLRPAGLIGDDILLDIECDELFLRSGAVVA